MELEKRIKYTPSDVKSALIKNFLRENARKGGLARAAKLTPERRREISALAGSASKGVSGRRKTWRQENGQNVLSVGNCG